MNCACLRLLDEKMCELSLVIQGRKGEPLACSQPGHFRGLATRQCRSKSLAVAGFQAEASSTKRSVLLARLQLRCKSCEDRQSRGYRMVLLAVRNWDAFPTSGRRIGARTFAEI
jgi:hypothetical protein